MEESTSREKILNKIRNALIAKRDIPYPDTDHDSPVFLPMEEGPEVNFAQEFNRVGGKFIYCEDHAEFGENLAILIRDNGWTDLVAADPKVTDLLDKCGISYVSGKEKLKSAKVGITHCEFLVSRLGSIMVSSAQLSGRRMFAFPETHIVVAFTSQLVPDIRDALRELRKKYEKKMPSMVTLITGPSRTADIEKTLVMGAHGPKDLYLFLLEDQN
jgi:L-lactate dehydrogenase complex protein LldG